MTDILVKLWKYMAIFFILFVLGVLSMLTILATTSIFIKVGTCTVIFFIGLTFYLVAIGA